MGLWTDDNSGLIAGAFRNAEGTYNPHQCFSLRTLNCNYLAIVDLRRRATQKEPGVRQSNVHQAVEPTSSRRAVNAKDNLSMISRVLERAGRTVSKLLDFPALLDITDDGP